MKTKQLFSDQEILCIIVKVPNVSLHKIHLQSDTPDIKQFSPQHDKWFHTHQLEDAPTLLKCLLNFIPVSC